jgi:hypothetical protein
MLKRGKSFEPGNQFGRGRPPGSRNKSGLRTKQLLQEHGHALLRKGILLALQGDTAMLRTLLDRILPRCREVVKTGPLPMRTAADIVQAYDHLGDKLAKGQLTIGDVQGIIPLIEAKRRAMETRDFEARMLQYEQHQAERERSVLSPPQPVVIQATEPSPSLPS